MQKPEAINHIKIQHYITDFAIVAHSMGGLLTRSFLKKYIQFNPKNINDIKVITTICSPMCGLSFAASGVNNSSIVVPAWRDLTTKSDFVTTIQEWDWPKEFLYHLIVLYEK